MMKDPMRRWCAGRGPVAGAAVLAATGCLWAAGARAAPWPHDDLTLEVPVQIEGYSRVVGGMVSIARRQAGQAPADPARVPVEVRCTVYRGGTAVASRSASEVLTNETPISGGDNVLAGMSGVKVYYRPLRKVLRIEFRNVRGVDRYRCELFIDNHKPCGSGQVCEVTGELPAQLTGPAAQKAGEAIRKGVGGLGGVRGAGGFAPKR